MKGALVPFRGDVLISGLREKHPAGCRRRRPLHTSSGHLVLAKFPPGVWFYSHRTLLPGMFLDRRSTADVAARHVRLALAP